MVVALEVLGPLRLRVDGHDRPLPGRRERLLLSLLATPPGRHVSDGRLIDELWGEAPPASAGNGLQVAVSRLRRTLGTDAEIRRDLAGYTLRGVEVDAARLLAAAEVVHRLAPAEVVAEVGAVLEQWRGTPYAGLDPTPTLAAESVRLEDARLALVVARAQALLDLGQPQEAHRGLAPEAVGHPFRERLHSLLALALYRCDRQADALEVLRRLRAALVEELGVDPSASVRLLEQQLLAQDPSLASPTVAPPAPSGRVPSDATRARVSGVVGRAGALASIHASLADLVTGARGGVLLISGDAGIGKSMLATEVIHRGRESAARVCVGRCHDAELAPPYWPWLGVLRDLAATAATVPPEVTALLEGTTTDDAGETPDAGAAAAATLRTFAAVSRFLGDQPAPVVVVLEDVHWSDRTSLRLLAYAAQELRDRPVLFVATVRTVDPRTHPHLGPALAGLARLAARRVPVPPLDADAVTELLGELGPVTDPALVEVLTRRSDGNPFFVLEMARLLQARGELSADAAARLEVPDGIADVLRLRVGERPDGTQEALGAAAVVGRGFDTGLLAEVLGRSALDDLDDALAAGLVEEESPGRLRFVHALTRETIYRDLPTRRRADWHARTGQVLQGRLTRDPELLGEVAQHYAAASAYLPEIAAAAVAHGADAAAAAERRGAFEESVALWARTLESERRVPGPDDDRRHTLLLAHAAARQRIGDMHGMLATLEEAVELARRRGDHQRMAEAITGHRSGGVWHWREVGEHDPHAIAVIEECLDHVEEPRLRARLHATLSLELYMAQDHDSSDLHGRRSLELARGLEDRELLRDCLVAREVALFTPDGAAERERCARESLAVADAPEHEIAARFHLGCALQQLGRGPEGDQAVAPAHALARRLRHTGSDVPLAWFRWLRAVETEQPGAEEIGREALALHRRTTVVGLSELTGLFAIVSAPPGSPVPRDVVASATGHPFVAFRTAVAHALALSGDVEGALRLRGEIGPLGGDYAALFSACLTAELLRLADDDRLREAVEVIRPYAGVFATYGSVHSLGSTALFVGSGLLALGEVDAAREHLEAAVAANHASGCRTWERVARQRLAALP